MHRRPSRVSQRRVGNGGGHRYRRGRCSDRRRWRVLRSAQIDAARHRPFSIRRKLSRSRLQGIDHSTRAGRFMANGKERASHLATQKCHEEFPENRERAFAEYFRRRKENADALADLAIGNFIEMRDKTASKTFRAKKKLDHALEGALPGTYLPLYTMVTFTRMPYAKAAKRAQIQDALVYASLWLIAAILVAAMLWLVAT